MDTDDALNDPMVRRVLTDAVEDDEFEYLEIALLELALYDLHANKDYYTGLVDDALGDDVEKYHRAMAKTVLGLKAQGRSVDPEAVRKYLGAFRGKEEVSKSKYITIAEYERRDGTVVPEHRRRLPQDTSRKSLEELKEIANEVRLANESPASGITANPERKKKLDRMNEVFAQAYNVAREGQKEREKEQKQERRQQFEEKKQKLEANLLYREGTAGEKLITPRPHQWDILATTHPRREGLRAALKEDSFGGSIVAVADMFASKFTDTTATLRFAARAIRDYGPLVGMRMAHAYHRYGGYDVPMRQEGGLVITEFGDVLPPDPSGPTETRQSVIQMLSSRLPGNRTYEAGSEPPSEGFIIDGDGNVIAHAVGRGSDHYLPFNAKHLKKMRKTDRVEFVRSRMVGGPTAEDLHTAMMMGADKLTVVSNGGVFTLDFTRRAHGIKLEHFEVVSRYQEILDEYAQSSEQRRGQRQKKGGVLDFAGYQRALEAISDEFPLHINFGAGGAREGPWSELHDTVQPKHRLMDQLKKLFGIEGSGGIVDPTTRKATPVRPGMTPEQRRGTLWEQYREDVARLPGGVDSVQGEINILNRMKDDVRYRGANWPKTLEDRLQALLDRKLERDTGVTQQPSSASAAMGAIREGVQETLDSSPYGTVVERKVDPSVFTQDTSSPASPRDPQTKKWFNRTSREYPAAMNFITTRGYNMGAPIDLQKAERTLKQIERALAQMSDDDTTFTSQNLWDQMESVVDDAFYRRGG